MKTQYITISPTPGLRGQVFYPLTLRTAPIPPLQSHSLLIKISAAALNHRDLFLRQHLYPGTTFGVPLLADGAGTVVDIGPQASPGWLGKRVVIYPGAGWSWPSSLEGPEDEAGYVWIIGGTKYNPAGTLSDYMVVDQGEVEPVPGHLSALQAAALPVAGLTAWRALMVKAGVGNCRPGSQILVTGIGGGVALMVLLFAVKMGARVWVTSSRREKVEEAVRLGAMGVVNYREEKWEERILELLPKERRVFDAVVDGAGGNIIDRAVKLLKAGGVVVIYGMTSAPSMSFPMRAVLKNLDIRGSALGSRREFAQMMDFVREKRVVPVIGRVVHGIDNLDAIEELFDIMRSGRQTGKLVISLDPETKL
ncbi:alcohol dehydrogenase [Aspergillus steynii IBT 23096]|uniref:Alcohol dehydrogenase n=1 Tax=Aspergillus steynii IBT 23096 TaxID=1392250 RepID=A0A2I2GKU4_9EURO|nr:alcohol dehydrogenase [Aspergillus steynii IBT 23096]PLB53496.1 alcohol dehydrogenase [Aspergillus steynii IBT 23096]